MLKIPFEMNENSSPACEISAFWCRIAHISEFVWATFEVGGSWSAAGAPLEAVLLLSLTEVYHFWGAQKREGLKKHRFGGRVCGDRRPVQQSEVKSMIQGDEGWWKESTETRGMDGGRTGDEIKRLPWRQKRGQRRKTRDQNQGWIIECEECIWKTIKRGCDPAGAGCRTTAGATWMKGRSNRRNQ